MIVGLTGYARSGKDSIAHTLVNKYGFERVAFADPIRELLYALNPIVGFDWDGGGWDLRSVVDIDGWDNAKLNPTIRRLLQTLGVGARNIIDEEIWVIKALRTMSGDGNYVVTDVRFENEIVALRFLGAQIWRVERPGVTAVNDHISETKTSTFTVDQTFINNGSLEDLEAMVTARMAGLLT